jgi:hypothetical protein
MPDPISTIIPSVESITSDPASKTELNPIKETAPVPSISPVTSQDAANTSAGNVNKTATSNSPKVVNKTKEPEILHPVDVKADTLTTIADKEEEEFIKEVIKEHQDGNK